MNTPTKVALVTGASSGFGYEFCHLLAEDGYDLAVVARRKEKLDKLARRIQEKYDRAVHVAIGGELPPRIIAFQVNRFLLGGSK